MGEWAIRIDCFTVSPCRPFASSPHLPFYSPLTLAERAAIMTFPCVAA